MTKQEAIDMTRELLNLLESLPDNGNINIITAVVDGYSRKRPPLSVHLYSGIEAAAETLEQAPAIMETAYGECMRREIVCGGRYEMFQLQDKAAPSDTDTGNSMAAQEEGIEPEYIVSWEGYDGCQRETRFKTREDAELEAADLREHTMFPESVSVTRWPDEPCR